MQGDSGSSVVYQEGDNMETVGVVSWGIAGCPANGASVMARLNLSASEQLAETHTGGGGVTGILSP